MPESGLCCFACTAYKHLLIPLQELLVVQEKLSKKEELFDEMLTKSRKFTFVLRLLAYVAMVAGICIFFSPITTLLGYIPLVGGFISGVAGFAIFIGAVLLCIPLFLMTTALAWRRFHPKMGLIMLGIGFGIFSIFWMTSGPPEFLEV